MGPWVNINESWYKASVCSARGHVRGGHGLAAPLGLPTQDRRGIVRVTSRSFATCPSGEVCQKSVHLQPLKGRQTKAPDTSLGVMY